MKQIKIKGKNKLTGTIRISGAKNAAVALIPAAILSDEDVTICNVPEISDINSLEEILRYLDVKFSRATESIIKKYQKIFQESFVLLIILWGHY